MTRIPTKTERLEELIEADLRTLFGMGERYAQAFDTNRPLADVLWESVQDHILTTMARVQEYAEEECKVMRRRIKEESA